MINPIAQTPPSGRVIYLIGLISLHSLDDEDILTPVSRRKGDVRLGEFPFKDLMCLQHFALTDKRRDDALVAGDVLQWS